MMLRCHAIQAALLALAGIGSIVFLAGVAATHAAANKDDIPLAERILMFTNAGIPAHASTAWTLGWSWIVAFLNIASTMLATLALLRLPALTIAAAALLTLSTSFLMLLCNCFLQLHYSLSGTAYDLTRHAVNCAFAGALIASCANMFICLCLGYQHGCTLACRREATSQEEGKPAPAVVAITATDAHSQAFVLKTEQAAAIGMV